MSTHNTNTDILLAGAIAAFTVDLLVYPLDTLKTRLQSPDYSRLYINASTNAVNKAALFRGLYQGVGSVIIATLPSSGAFFTTYEGAKHIFSSHNPSFGPRLNPLLPQPLIHSAASAIAELVSCAILTPAEVIKQNAQMVRASSGPNATMQTLTRFRRNPFALWRGYSALAGRNLPFTALQFPMFERLRQAIRKRRDDSGRTTGTLLESGVITAVSAGTAGSIAAVITTPIDVIKTRIMLAAGDDTAQSQAQKGASGKMSGHGLVDAFGNPVKSMQDKVKDGLGSMGKGGAQSHRKSSWAIAKEVFQESGLRGLWRGGALRGLWTMLGSGLYLGVYDSGRIWLAKRRGENLHTEELF